MQINTSKTAIQNILDLVNGKNAGLNLTEAQVSVGVPSVFSEAENPRNSQVTLTALGGSGYTGTKTIKYTRLGVGQGVAVLPSQVYVVGAETEAEIKTAVATALNLVESEIEISALTLPVDSSTPGQVSVAPKVDSLLYVGASLDVVLAIAPEDLESAIANDQMDGFDPAA